jgi:hypothetical protein
MNCKQILRLWTVKAKPARDLQLRRRHQPGHSWFRKEPEKSQDIHRLFRIESLLIDACLLFGSAHQATASGAV